MADQREAVEMIDAGTLAEMQRCATSIAGAFRRGDEPDAQEVSWLASYVDKMACSTIALDDEVRRLRGEAVEREQRVEDLLAQRNAMLPLTFAAEEWGADRIGDDEMQQQVDLWINEDKPDLADFPSGMSNSRASNFDLAAFFDAKTAWSRETFGPGDRYAGVVKHIRKELDEIEAEPSEAVEWIDVVLLAMDGAWRSAGLDGGEFVAVLKAKDGANRMRTWPDWRTLKPGEVSEHVKPAPSNPGASEPSEAAVERVARALMLAWSAHVEARDADETAEGDGDVVIVAMSFDEAVALAREAIRLGADPGRAR